MIISKPSITSISDKIVIAIIIIVMIIKQPSPTLIV